MEQKILYQKYLKLISNRLNILPDKSEENANNTLAALWQTAAGNRMSPISAQNTDLPVLNSSQLAVLNDLIKSRLDGVPLAHLTERQNFLELDYLLDKGNYIPRKETELLARTSIEVIKKDFIADETVHVIDLCTGIGTVALAIAYYCKNTRVFGSDIFEPAINAAKINAKHFGLENSSTFFHADMFDPFDSLDLKGKTNLIVCAPPYISSAKVKQMAKEIADHEPAEAFDAGAFGLSIFNKLISIAPDYLCENGYLIFECGLGQGEFLSKRLSSNGSYGEITEVYDELGNIRVLKARKISDKH